MLFIFNSPITFCLMPWYILQHLSCGCYIVEKFNLKMKLLKSEKAKFAFGLILIILVYSCYYIFFSENENATFFSRKVRHLIQFSITVLVYLIGTFFLGKLEVNWMSYLWHLIHITGLGIITSIGCYDWFIAETALKVKLVAISIQEMLISPVLYVAMGLLNKTLNKQNK